MHEALPEPVLRVGVTGARDINPAQLPRLRAQVAEIIRQLPLPLREGAGGGVRESPSSGPVRSFTQTHRLMLLSPLAEGADRLVAEAALERGFRLVCPLPFTALEYERDFSSPDSVAEFRALLARAEDRVLEMDGARGDNEARSYEALGRLIVRNTDLIIGIWDGHPGRGLGGTAEIIRYAARFGPPVIWLHASDPDVPPRWIEGIEDLHQGHLGKPVRELLAEYLHLLLQVPAGEAHAAHHHSLLHRVGAHTHSACATLVNRLRSRERRTHIETFLDERPHAKWWPWRLHGWMMRTLAGGSDPPRTDPRAPGNPTADAWYRRYQSADEHAGAYAMRYRSSYVWIFILGALALSAAAVSLSAADWPVLKGAASVVELVALLCILGLVVADGVTGWQRRAIEYRLIAELCRKQQNLAPLGWTVPHANAWARTRHGVSAGAPWLVWLFGAWLRATPLASGRIDPASVSAAQTAALNDLINDQIAYHQSRRAQSRLSGRRLVNIGEWLFFAVLVVVVVKLGLLGSPAAATMHPIVVLLGIAGGILPALSAAVFGIRAYAELEMLAEQSDTMLAAMRRARTQIELIDPSSPLASQEVGSLLAGVAKLMLEDLDGWARLFSAKVVEA